MIADINPLVEATKAKKQVTLNYRKESNGEIVEHSGGIYEIGINKAGNSCLWLWDVNLNDHIRQFLLSNINSFQVLNVDFFPPQAWPIKINGEIVG